MIWLGKKLKNYEPQIILRDVNGNHQVTALGDGLMIIRKLFGAAFAGEKLTANAITSDSTKNTDEIHDYIAAMSDIGSGV